MLWLPPPRPAHRLTQPRDRDWSTPCSSALHPAQLSRSTLPGPARAELPHP